MLHLRSSAVVVLFFSIALIISSCGGQATLHSSKAADITRETEKSTQISRTEQPPNSTLIAKIAQTAVQATLTAHATLIRRATSTPTITPSSTPTPSPPPKPKAVVLSQKLNVRAGPSTSHPVIAEVKRGDKLSVIGRNQDGSWIEILLPSGGSGWVYSKMVAVDDYGQGIEVSKVIPTPPPVTKMPPPTSRTLKVSFINPHYECQQREWSYTGDDGKPHRIWGYRSFQVDMYIKNNGTKPVTPPWRPSRWIITDGRNDYVNDLIWEWVDRRTGFYHQPVIHPGESAGWTFLAFPIGRNQWVKAVEFYYKGQRYRQEFDLGPYHNDYDYRDCGAPAPHTVRPTPTPWP